MADSRTGPSDFRHSSGLEAAMGVFGELLTAKKVDDIDIEFIYPQYNTDFEMAPAIITGDGQATVTNQMLQVSSASSGSVRAPSKDYIRYKGGHTAFADFTFRVGGSSGFAEIGAVDANNGWAVRYYNTTGLWSVVRKKAGVVVQESDQTQGFNGNADLARLNRTKINIFRLIYGYLGVADCYVFVKQGKWKLLHVIETEGLLESPTVANPNLPISVYAENGATAYTASWNGGIFNSSEVSRGSRFFCVDGDDLLSGTVRTTAGVFRNKTSFKGVNNTVKAQLLKVELFVDAPESGVGTVQVKILKNATLSGTPSWVDVDTENSIVELDLIQEYVSGGRQIGCWHIGYSSGAAASASKTGGSESDPTFDLALYLLPGETATITKQNVSGNTNVRVRHVFNWIELF